MYEPFLVPAHTDDQNHHCPVGNTNVGGAIKAENKPLKFLLFGIYSTDVQKSKRKPRTYT